MAKRVRKPNFTERESTKLLELVDSNINTINQNGNTLRTNTAKKELWNRIAAEVSALSLNQRDEEECRKKWRDLKRAVTAYRTHCRGTGGGPPQSEPPFYQWILKILGDSVVVDGISVEIPDSWNVPNVDTYPLEDITLTANDGFGNVMSSTPLKRLVEQPAEKPQVEKDLSPVPHVGEDSEVAANAGALTGKTVDFVAKKFDKLRSKKRQAAQTSDGDPDLWDQWLKVQIIYYKQKTETEKDTSEYFRCKTELVKEQLKRLKDE